MCQNNLIIDDKNKYLDIKMAAIIAEYSSLREEISNRSKDQLVCVTGSVTAVSVLLGVIAANPGRYSGLLIVMPWILSVFGIIWCDHAHGLHLIAKYIREEIEQKKIPNLLSEEMDIGALSTLGWESKLQNERNNSVVLGLINPLLPIIYYFLPSVISLVGYYFLRFEGVTNLPIVIEYCFVSLAVILLFALIYFWRRLKNNS